MILNLFNWTNLINFIQINKSNFGFFFGSGLQIGNDTTLKQQKLCQAILTRFRVAECEIRNKVFSLNFFINFIQSKISWSFKYFNQVSYNYFQSMTEYKTGEQFLQSSSEHLVSPNCIRSVQIHNKSIWIVQVEVTHRSGYVTRVSISRGQSKIIERDCVIGLNHVFDPIKEGKVYRGGYGIKVLLSFNDSNAHGVENRQYTIEPEVVPWTPLEQPIQKKQKIYQVTFVNGSKKTVKAVVQLSVQGIVELTIEPEAHKTVSCLFYYIRTVPQYFQHIEYGVLSAQLNEETTKIIFTFDTAGGKGGSVREYYINENLDVLIKQPRT